MEMANLVAIDLAAADLVAADVRRRKDLNMRPTASLRRRLRSLPMLALAVMNTIERGCAAGDRRSVYSAVVARTDPRTSGSWGRLQFSALEGQCDDTIGNLRARNHGVSVNKSS